MGAEVLANMLALTPQYYHDQLVSIGGLRAGEMLNWFVHEAGFRLKPTALLETVASADAALLDALFIVGGDGQRILVGVFGSGLPMASFIDKCNQEAAVRHGESGARDRKRKRRSEGDPYDGIGGSGQGAKEMCHPDKPAAKVRVRRIGSNTR